MTISMKRLYQWAAEYAAKTIVYDEKRGNNPKKYKEYLVLIGFLGYVWKRRNLQELEKKI